MGYFIADDNGTIYAHDIRTRAEAEAILASIESDAAGIEILSDDDEER